MFKDYYQILEIQNSASIAEIKKAYRQLALKYHPDKNKDFNAQEKFVEITEAYEVLKNFEQRNIYDQLYNSKKSSEKATERNYTERQKQWTYEGRAKAKEYSEMDFDLFIKNIIGEIKVVAKNSLSIGLVIFCVIGAIAGFSLMSISPFLGIFTILLWGSLGVLLFKRTKENYKNDRNKMFNN